MGNLGLFDQTSQLLEANLDRRVISHRLISRNISNVDTPNYKGTSLEFEKQLRAALDGGVVPTSMARTQPGHLPYGNNKPFGQAASQQKETGPVHLDIEMSRLAENNIMFSAMVQLLGKKFSTLKAAISERTGS